MGSIVNRDNIEYIKNIKFHSVIFTIIAFWALGNTWEKYSNEAISHINSVGHCEVVKNIHPRSLEFQKI